MKYLFYKHHKSLLILILLAGLAFPARAQQLRTSYFMDKSIARLSMNPAFQPARGYVNIPVIGSIGASYNSNGLALEDIFFPKDGELVTFLDGSVHSDDFLKNLKDNNQFNIDFYTSIISTGWFSGRAFWTVDFALKATTTFSAPKTLFEFMKKGTGKEGSSYDMSDININLNSYAELAIGYSRPWNDKLMVGGKLKFLFGAANAEASIDHLQAELYNDAWTIRSYGKMNASFKGLSITNNTDNQGREYIDDFDVDSPGLGGFGAAIDLGATYKLLDNLTLSAALTDLGLIYWNAANSIGGEIKGEEFRFEGFDLAIGENDDHIPSMSDQFDDLKDDITNLYHFKETSGKSRTTWLRATLNIGGEYAILDNKISFGLLSSTRFYNPKAYTELTVSGNFRPCNWFAATLSYSCIHSDFQTFGFGLNFSPCWINFFLGSDYMVTKVTPQYVPISSSALNLHFGLAIPLARKKVQGEKE